MKKKGQRKDVGERRCNECTMSTPIMKGSKVWLWCLENDKYCKNVAGNCKRRIK